MADVEASVLLALARRSGDPDRRGPPHDRPGRPLLAAPGTPLEDDGRVLD
jgi:hypothetical protein